MADDDQQMRATFPQLMQTAREIKSKAVKQAALEQAVINSGTSEGAPGPQIPVDYEKIEQKYANIEDLFEPFSKMPDPTRYEPMINVDLTTAMEQLSQDGGASTDPIDKTPIRTNISLSKMKTADDYLGGWNGEAALKFKENFLDPFPALTGNQFLLISTMRGALQAHQAMWDRARISIARIAKNTQDALDNVDGCGKNDWSFAFGVLAAVASVGGAFLTAGASIPFSAIGAAAAVGSASIAGITATGGGGSVDAVINSMKHAMDQLRQEVEQTEQKIAAAVHGITNTVNGQQDYFVAKRPTIAGMQGSDITSSSGMGSVNG